VVGRGGGGGGAIGLAMDLDTAPIDRWPGGGGMGNFAKELFEAQEGGEALRIRSGWTRGGEENLGRLGGDGRGEKGDSEAHERRGIVSAALDGFGTTLSHTLASSQHPRLARS
jgi:hypothetical protein